MQKYKVGYTQGTFDMFHIGHLNLINRAKANCEFLIVGVNANQLVEQYKNKCPVVDEKDRREIISNLKAVDQAVIVNSLDKVESFKQLGFDVVFIGDDWKGSKRWEETEQELKQFGVDVVFLPYTNGVSSTKLRLEKDFAVNE